MGDMADWQRDQMLLPIGDDPQPHKEICVCCDGSGEGRTENSDCVYCDGTGVVEVEEDE